MSDSSTQTPPTVTLEELTWPEVEAAINAGTRTVVVPVGSTEQHGPHLPLATDALIGEAVAERTAERLGDALVAPPVRPGCSGHHMDFPGTVTVGPELLMDLLRAHARSLSAHGFEYVAFLPSHGGNFAPVNTVVPEIARDLDAARVVALADLGRLMELMNEGLREGGVDYQEPVIHAGAAETAAILAIDEDLVREERLEAGYEGDLQVTALLSEGFRHFTENGVLGDPREATREAGKAILDTIAEAYAEEVREARESV